MSMTSVVYLLNHDVFVDVFSGITSAIAVPYCYPAGLHGTVVTAGVNTRTSHQHHTFSVHLLTAQLQW
jgi:siroheme synthase